MSVTIADVVKLQMDYFYGNPETVGKMLMLPMPKRETKRLIREAQKRGVDVAAAFKKEFERHNRIWGRLAAR